MQVHIISQVREFILSLDLHTQAKYKHAKDMLEKFAYELRMPLSKKVASRLFELRIKGKQEVRIFYTFYKDSAWLLHGFVKKSQATPLKEVRTAVARMRLLTAL